MPDPTPHDLAQSPPTSRDSIRFDTSLLEPRLLEALDAVVDGGGFERAAARLHVTQSAVSQRIRLLEDRLGRPVLVRATPPRPTELGRRLLRHVRRLRLLEDDLRAELDRDAPSPRLPIGVNADSLATWVLPALLPLALEHGWLLDLRVQDQERTHALLRAGEVAGCVSTRPEPMQGCRVARLGRMDYPCTCTPAFRRRWFPHGLTPEAAALAPAVLYNRDDGLHDRFLAREFGPDGVPDYPRHYVPSSEGFVALVTAGAAYGLTPQLQVREALARGGLVDLAPGRPMPVELHWHTWNLDSAALAQVSAALQAADLA
ncbi:MAG: LysR family transcriptional regulator ArgP [Desulfovibrionaceae bacterium]